MSVTRPDIADRVSPDATSDSASVLAAAAPPTPAPAVRTLFTPVRLGRYLLRNRIVMAPMTRHRAEPDGQPSPMHVPYYAQRASAGLLITEGTWIAPQGKGYARTPGIHTARQVDGWRAVTDAVHARGGRIFVQLWHVGRVSHPSLQPDHARPVAPSSIVPAGRVRTADGELVPYVPPQPLTAPEIQEVVREYAGAARRAIDAGFDGVELHGANGYLIDQFLRSGTNRRTDAYGGPIAHRVRFLREVVEAVSQAVDADRVGLRLSPRGPFNDMSDEDPEETFGYAAETLNAFGLAYLHVIEPKSGRDAENPNDALLPGPRVTLSIRARYRGTLMLNGDYSRDLAEETLAQGEAELISFGKPFISNPDLVERFAADAPLQPVARATLYTAGPEGYIDYPAWDGTRGSRD